MLRFRAGKRVVARRGLCARHLGLLALRSASGLGPPAVRAGRPAPTAFNRAGEKLQAAGGELPWVKDEVGPLRLCGLALPLIGEEGRGRPWRVRDGSAGQAACAGLGACWLAEAAAGSQLVPWATMQ